MHTIVEVLNRGEAVDGRLMSFLLRDPVQDGGQWDMIVNIIKKYGVMPKKCFPMTFSGEQSVRLNTVLRAKVIYLFSLGLLKSFFFFIVQTLMISVVSIVKLKFILIS